MIFGRRAAPQASKSNWVEVAPGERGTPEDEFTSFTYWVPSQSLLDEIHKDARESGHRLIPDVTSIGEVEEPDGHGRIRGIVLDACWGRTTAAIEIFKPVREDIAELTTALDSVEVAQNPGRANAQRATHRGELARKEAFLESLEDALESRLRQLVSYFDSLSAEFVQELTQSHPYPNEVLDRWKPQVVELSDEMRDFGQATARAQIARVRPARSIDEGNR